MKEKFNLQWYHKYVDKFHFGIRSCLKDELITGAGSDGCCFIVY